MLCPFSPLGVPASITLNSGLILRGCFVGMSNGMYYVPTFHVKINKFDSRVVSWAYIHQQCLVTTAEISMKEKANTKSLITEIYITNKSKQKSISLLCFLRSLDTTVTKFNFFCMQAQILTLM